MARTLILGATGETGFRLVQQMLLNSSSKPVPAEHHDQHGHETTSSSSLRVITRSKERFNQLIAPTIIQKDMPKKSPDLAIEVIEASILDMTDEEFSNAIQGCDAIVSCLGHNMTLKGIYGKQSRKLVTDTVERVHRTISSRIKQQQSNPPVKFILMNTAGAAHPAGTDDDRTFLERTAVSFIRTILPPHRDNEGAVSYLYHNVGGGWIQNEDHDDDDTSYVMEWVVVRPDSLIDEDDKDIDTGTSINTYETLSKPKAGLFGDNVTSRSNVAHFMSELITDEDTWEKWKFQMPYICNTN